MSTVVMDYNKKFPQLLLHNNRKLGRNRSNHLPCERELAKSLNVPFLKGNRIEEADRAFPDARVLHRVNLVGYNIHNVMYFIYDINDTLILQVHE
jgi:hypothetical protein